MLQDGWDDSIRTPSPDSDFGDDEAIGNELGGYADLARELDTSKRYDAVTHTRTPFTIAAANGRQGSNAFRPTVKSIRVAGEPTNRRPPTPPRPAPPPRTALPPRPSPPTKAPLPKPQAGDSKYNARRLTASITKKPTTQTNKEGGCIPPPPVTRKPPSSGWTDAFDNPIPKEPPKKKGVIDKVDDYQTKEEKRKRKNEKAAATRAKNKKLKQAQEEIKFGIMPSGATANDDFPILQGIAKMNELPTKTTKGKGKGKKGKKNNEDESNDTNKSLGAEALHQLICGEPKGVNGDNKGEAEEPSQKEIAEAVKEKKETPSQISKRERELSLQQVIERSTRETSKRNPLSKRQLWAPTKRAELPINLAPARNDESFKYLSTGTANNTPKNREALFLTPPSDDNDEVICIDTPSTITQLPSSAIRKIEEIGNTSSEVAPPTSPLDQYNKTVGGLLAPRPRRQGEHWIGVEDVELLERSAEDSKSNDKSLVNTRVHRNRNLNHDPEQLPTPHTSTFNYRPPLASQTNRVFSNTKHRRTPSPTEFDFEAEKPKEEWSTLPPVPSWRRQKKNTKLDDHYRLDSKYRRPINLFPLKNNNNNNKRITDSLKDSVTPSPFKFDNNRTNSLMTTETEDKLVSDGKFRLRTWKPTGPEEDQPNSKSSYKLKTSRGDKYGSSVTSNTNINPYERSDRLAFQSRSYIQPNHASSSKLGYHHQSSSSYAQDHFPRRSSNGNGNYHTSQFTNNHNHYQPTYHTNEYTNRPSNGILPAHNVYGQDPQTEEDQEEEEDWTKAWSKSAHRKPSLPG